MEKNENKAKTVHDFSAMLDRFGAALGSQVGTIIDRKRQQQMIKIQDGKKKGKRRKKEAIPTFESWTLGLFLVPGGE